MRVNPIPTGLWTVSPTGHRFMLAAALATFVAGTLLLVMNASVVAYAWFGNRTWLTDAIGAIGAAGSLTLYFGMWRHWYEHKQTPVLQFLWAVMFVVAVWYGSLVFWATVYRRSRALHRDSPTARYVS